MNQAAQPEWKPIEFLPLYITMIRGILENSLEQYESLLEARTKPYVLDDHIIQRTLKLFSAQKEDHWIWEHQLNLWEQLDLAPFQKKILHELQEDAGKLKALNIKILDLAREIEPHTLDCILTKDDGALASDFLLQQDRDLHSNEPFFEEIETTIEHMAELEVKYQDVRQTLHGIFCRFTPHIPSYISKEGGHKLGVKLTQLQNIALRAMFADYCLFHHFIQGKTLIAEFMDQNVSQLTEEELLALNAFQNAMFVVLEAKAVLIENALAVYDLLGDEHMILFDEGMSEHMVPGLLIICHLVHKSGVLFTTDTAVVIGPETHCGQLIRKEIQTTKENIDSYEKEDYVTKILQLTYQNL